MRLCTEMSESERRSPELNTAATDSCDSLAGLAGSSRLGLDDDGAFFFVVFFVFSFLPHGRILIKGLFPKKLIRFRLSAG